MSHAPPTALVSSDLDVDGWGRSTRARRLTGRLLDPLYRYWFRVEWKGLDNLPSAGPALLVANHAGVLPFDAPLIMHGIEAEIGRAVYTLHHETLRATPFVGTALARNGGVVANPDNARRLLEDDGALVLVFPEGAKGTTKAFTDRYRLQRFGRGGFVQTALQAGVPIIPLAVMGTEETMPAVTVLPGADGQPQPVTLNSVLLGPAFAFFPFPSKIRIHALAPLHLAEPPGLESYPANTVADIAEEVRETIQAELDAMLAARLSVLGG